MLNVDYNSRPLYDPPEEDTRTRHADLPTRAFPLVEPLEKRVPEPRKPRPYRILRNIQSVSSCMNNDAAIDTDGALWTWGSMRIGRLFDMVSFDLPVTIDYVPKKRMEHVAAVTTGVYHTMCITTDGQLWGWGGNQYGQLGVGDLTYRKDPVRVMSGVTHVAAGDNVTFAIREDGTLWGWGDNGTCVFQAPEECVHTPLRLLDHVVAVSGSQRGYLAVQEDGTLWGSRDTFAVRGIKGPVPLMENIADVAVPPVAEGFGLILAKNGDLYSVGAGIPGSIVPWQKNPGFGIPVKVLSHVAKAWCGRSFSLILLQDGRLLASGDNGCGECGIGRFTVNRYYKPVYVMPNAKAAAAGYGHGLGLQRNGDLWIWGGNYSVPG